MVIPIMLKKTTGVVDLLKMKRHHLGRGLTSMKFDYREILLNELSKPPMARKDG
jgi:hypothetical protein